jgi:rhodanese-related sulfurtransferase
MAKTVDELLAEARALLPYRPSPAEALAAQANGALLVDIRGDDQRRADGLIPGAVLLARNVLEWRCDPASPWRDAAIRTWDQVIIVVCQEGFQSSLAAAALQRLGLRNATDLDGGFAAWREAGLPVVAPRVLRPGPAGAAPPQGSTVDRPALKGAVAGQPSKSQETTKRGSSGDVRPDPPDHHITASGGPVPGVERCR